MRQRLELLSFSDQLYRRFLRAYPAEYKEAFTEEMAQVFRDLCREIYEREGLPGLLELWLTTLFDLVKTSLEERLKEATHMTKEKVISLSGWALMLAAVAFVLGFSLGGGESSFDDPLGGTDAFYEYGQLILIPLAMLLFTLGMLGLRSRYGSEVGRFGRISLSIGAVGGAVGFVGALGLGLGDGDGWWIGWLVGMLLVLVGLLLFGIAALRNRPLPRWNGLPLLTGSTILLFPIMGVITGSDELSVPVMATIFFLIGAGFAALGYIVQGDVRDEFGTA